MRKWLIAAAAAVALLLLGGGIAYASIPGPDGVVHGCYKNSTGMLITIDSAAACPTGYTALNWNQTGPQGPAGTDGTNGTDGANGVSGYEVVQGSISLPNDGNLHVGTISCPTGKVALGSGWSPDIQRAQPSEDLDGVPTGIGWDYTVRTAGGGGTYVFHASITCATVGG
jgi:hypothetical protein